MMFAYLIGPLSAQQAWRYRTKPHPQGFCRAFNAIGNLDLRIDADDTWEQVCRRLPTDWRPDFIALHLSGATIPSALWSALVPLIGLAGDWDRRWHAYRHLLPACDLVLADAPGVDTLRRAGLDHVRSANLRGLGPHGRDLVQSDSERSLDIVFVGDVDCARHRHHRAWLGRLARLASRWHVLIRTGVPEPECQSLLSQARIVFNPSTHGECNRRAFEAAAAGALLFQEANNREVPRYFEPGREYIAYNADNLEALLEHYLNHEDERRAIAQAAQARVRSYGFDDLWQQALAGIEAEWDSVCARARQRRERRAGVSLLGRVWQAVPCCDGGDPHLIRDLTAALQQQPNAAELHNALGLAVGLATSEQPCDPDVCEQAAVHFRQALVADPYHAVAGLNLIEALVGAGRTELAIQGAQHLLALVEGGRGLHTPVLDAGHFPPLPDAFHFAWQQAAWSHAGQPEAEAEAKRRLLRWRLHELLADLTGELVHYQQATQAWPDNPVTQARLGCALGRARQSQGAAQHLHQAVLGDPFDGSAARALYQALSECGDPTGARRLARARRLLAQAAPQLVPAERWFLEAAPVGDELASLIISCAGAGESTRRCLESVLQYTRPPYELILLANGSADISDTSWEAIRSRSGPTRVEILHPQSQAGSLTGCDQAMRLAQGRYLAFLDDAMVVTPGWLEGLLAWSLHDWPQVGLVGAVGNTARPPQQVPADYQTLDELRAFAEGRRRVQAGQALEVERLDGWGFLARREVLDRLGGINARGGQGQLDHEDLCNRVRRAGFRLLVALDVFLHHGGRTFADRSSDTDRPSYPRAAPLLTPWQAEPAAQGTHPGTDVRHAPPQRRLGPAVRRPRVSLCLIVKNEEDNLPACLDSVADLFDDTVVVDTGSTDATRQVAARYGARVFDFPWCDSFAAARNEALRHAQGEWIFWLDADDRLDEANRTRLRGLLAGLGDENRCYVLKCLCLPDPLSGAATVVDHIRLFRNHPDIRWQYRVHEQILPAIRRHQGQVCWTDIVIQHSGYQDPALRRKKLDRDLRLLCLEDSEHPDDPFTLFNLGSVLQELGQHAEALPVLRRSLERSHSSDSIVRKLYALIVGCHRVLGQSQQALAACQEGRQVYPDDTELLFVESILRKDGGDLAGAEACLVQLLNSQPAAHFGSVDTGLRGYKARHNLAVLHHQQGRGQEAEVLWRQALAERADFLPAWLGLGELHLRRQDWQALAEVARRVEELAGGATESVVLRARACLARRDFATARSLLAEAIGRWPQALGPRVILSHALLQEGRDLAAAERALRDVLALAPEHGEARHNLDLLLQRHGA